MTCIFDIINNDLLAMLRATMRVSNRADLFCGFPLVEKPVKQAALDAYRDV